MNGEEKITITGGSRTVTTTLEKLKKAADALKTDEIQKQSSKDESEWMQAPSSVVKLAQDLIRDHHPSLKEAWIAILMRTKPTTSKGKVVMGHAEKVSEKWKALVKVDFDFLIWLDDETWGESDEQRRRAILDHELCHCKYDPGTGKTSLRGHDIEEFGEIVERYGAWKADLLNFKTRLERGEQNQPAESGKVTRQLSMLPPKGGVITVDPAGGFE